MQFGISSACFYPRLVEEAAEAIAAHRLPVAELFLNTESEFAPQFLQSIRACFDESGTKVCAVHPYTAPMESLLYFSEYERRFHDGLELLLHFAVRMQLLDAKILVLHGCSQAYRAPDERIFERFAIMRDTLRREGIVLAQENVAPFRSHSLDFLTRMRDYLHGDISFVLDIKQAVRAGEDPLAMARTLAPQLVHLHLSDHRAGADCLPIGAGEFRFDELFAILRTAGYRGDGVLELYRENFCEDEELFASCALLDKIAKNE